MFNNEEELKAELDGDHPIILSPVFD